VEKQAGKSIVALVQVLDAPLETAGATPLAMVGGTASGPLPDAQARPAVEEMVRRLDVAMHVMWALVNGRRLTPWRVLTRGPRGFLSDWLSPAEQGVVSLLLGRYFAQASEVAKVRAGYAAEPAADPLPALTTLADACAQLSRELRELVGRQYCQ
jgi:hypothetical protein